MLKNYFKIIVRNLLRHKMFALINLAGLISGFTTFLLIISWVGYEFSYDKFNENYHRIQRIGVDLKAGSHMIYPMTMPNAAENFVRDYPEIVNAVRMEHPSHAPVKIGEKNYIQENCGHADNSIFEIFTLPFIRGNPDSALDNPFTVVIAESVARKFFPDQDPMGKIIRLNDKTDYTVTGVIKDFPQNSHFRFDIIGSYETLYAQLDDNMDNWFHIQFFTYLLFAENADMEKFQQKLPAFTERYLGEILANAGAELSFFLQPLQDIHLHSDLAGEIAVQADIKYLYLFAGIAFFILLIAFVNFINLSTATASLRAKEIGLRKTFGSSRGQIRQQIFLESLLFCLLAMLASVAIVENIRPHFRELFGTYVDFSYLDISVIIGILTGFPLITAIIAGSYPMLILSSLDPVTIMKPGYFRITNRSILRNILVVFQFTISVILIIATLTIFKQINFMKRVNPGFDKENVIIIPGVKQLINNVSADALRKELENIPEIKKTGLSSLIPGRGIQKAIMYPENYTMDEPQMGEKLFVDAGFIECLGMKILKGRNFLHSMSGDTWESVIINETAAEQFGWNEPVGKCFNFKGSNGEIFQRNVIGLVKDFHSTSLHENIKPLIIYNDFHRSNFLILKTDGSDIAGIVKDLKAVTGKLNPGFSVRYYLLDDVLDKMYKREIQTGKLSLYFTLLSIILGCLGLLGLSTFIVEDKTKEIGIRKVMGASVSNVTVMLTAGFCRWVLLAVVLAIPLSGWLMNRWMNEFAYKTVIGLFVYGCAAIIALSIAIITVSFQTVRISSADPAKTLKYE